MRLGLFSSMAALLAGTGLALGQTSAPTPAGLPTSAPTTATMYASPGKALPGDMPSASQAPSTGPVVSGAPPTYMGPAHDTGCGSGDCSYGSANGFGGGGLGDGHVLHDLLGEHADGSWEPQHYHIWGNVEYLLWRFGTAALPPLTANVNVGSVNVFFKTLNISNGVPILNINGLDVEPVTVQVSPGLPAGNSVSFGDQPGMRLSLGVWLDPEERIGVDGSYWMLWRKTVGFTNAQNQGNNPFSVIVQAPAADNQSITTQVTNATTSAQNTITVPVNISAIVQSVLTGSASNEMWGTDLNVRTRAWYYGPVTVDFFGGLRYVDIDQKLYVNSTVIVSPSNGPQKNSDGNILSTNPNATTPPFQFYGTDTTTNLFSGDATLTHTSTSTTFDFVDAHNRFYGAQIGASVNWRLGYGVDIFGFGKLAVGDMRQNFSLYANTVGANNTAGGLIVGPADNGLNETRDRFCVIPEINVNLGYEITSTVRAYVGYNAMYFSAVAKVADQATTTTPNVNTVVFGAQSTSQTITVPGFKATSSMSTLQGLNAGVEIRY